jgi:diguanylate cyclase (GGDEF)-like protein
MIKHGAHDELRKPFEAAELTARVAAAARVKSLQDELRRRNIELDLLSRTDPLTGVHNRRHVDEQMGFISSAARRHGQDVSVLMCDIDHFKAINDAHGHAAGDMVLTAIVGRFRACLRTEDVLGRWGGEEFIIVCPFTDLPGATVAAERVRTRVADTPVAIPECEPMSVTVSVGCASGRGEAPDSLVRRADAALFAAKEAGRNLVRTAPAEPPTSPGVDG